MLENASLEAQGTSQAVEKTMGKTMETMEGIIISF